MYSSKGAATIDARLHSNNMQQGEYIMQTWSVQIPLYQKGHKFHTLLKCMQGGSHNCIVYLIILICPVVCPESLCAASSTWSKLDAWTTECCHGNYLCQCSSRERRDMCIHGDAPCGGWSSSHDSLKTLFLRPPAPQLGVCVCLSSRIVSTWDKSEHTRTKEAGGGRSQIRLYGSHWVCYWSIPAGLQAGTDCWGAPPACPGSIY